MTRPDKDENLDRDVIDRFGREWADFDYSELDTEESPDVQFKAYFSPIDLAQFNRESAVAADFGAVSGRWCPRLLPYFF